MTLGADSWKVASFQADAQSLPGKIRVWLYKSTETEYPQFQGWMDAHTGENVGAGMMYMANEDDVDADAYPKTFFKLRTIMHPHVPEFPAV